MIYTYTLKYSCLIQIQRKIDHRRGVHLFIDTKVYEYHIDICISVDVRIEANNSII